jgi:formylglycine-generating enzyme required for sulfatase activity
MTNSIGMVLVRLSPNYWAGKFEVTQGEYEKMTGNNPSRSKSRNDPLLPVESITWNEAMKFCEQLTAREKAAGFLPAGTAYTLPGEKQWNELLSDAKFDGAVTSDGGKRDGPAPVGSASAPNKLGFFDLFGNVWEWTVDEGDTHQKLILGGAYNSLKGYALKRQLAPDKQSANIGFRCILVSQP